MKEYKNRPDNGIQLLIKKHKDIFRMPENLEHYSQEDFKAAEKKYLKFILTGRVE